MGLDNTEEEPSCDAIPVARSSFEEKDVFGDDQNHQIKFRVLTWPYVAFIMINEVVTGGVLLLPQAIAVVGLVPGVILTTFCGIWALSTSYLLIDFKLNHPDVHNMGDAGYILFSPYGLGAIGREVLSLGTLIFAIVALAVMLILGEAALATLSGGGMCAMAYTGIWAAMTFVFALPRTFSVGLDWFSILACALVFMSTVVGMVGSGIEPVPDRVVVATTSTSFYTAFLAITNPVLAFAGHFMFFPLISEMKQPRDAKKAAWALQVFATTWYVLFAVVSYVFLGSEVQSPSYLSLSTKWAKASWGLIVPSMIVAGSLYLHTAAKLVFVRIFRNSRHLHSHTITSWAVWVGLLVIANATGFVLATGIPFFSYLSSIASSLFAAWYTYGLAGAFWWHDTHYLGHGWDSVRRKWPMFILSFLTLLGGAFVCVGGMYATIRSLSDAYKAGGLGTPFTCKST